MAATATTETMSGQRMRAIVQKAYGTADVLTVDEIDRPVIGPDEVLVQVHAAGLDRRKFVVQLKMGGAEPAEASEAPEGSEPEILTAKKGKDDAE